MVVQKGLAVEQGISVPSQPVLPKLLKAKSELLISKNSCFFMILTSLAVYLWA